MSKCLCWSLAAALFFPGSCLSQLLTTADLSPGALIQVKEWERSPRTGVFLSAETVKLIWRPGATADSGLDMPDQSVLFSSIEEIQLSLGKKRLGWNGLLLGTGVFAGLGWLVGKGIYYSSILDDPVDEDTVTLKAMGWGALVGLPIGVMLAFGGRQEEWAPVRLPGARVTPRVSFGPGFVPGRNHALEVGFEMVF